MNPEDRIRMLMEENAMLRARLGEAKPCKSARPSPRTPPSDAASRMLRFRLGTPLLDDADPEAMERDYQRRMSGGPPEASIQEMPYREGHDPGPYMKKMPHKGSGSGSSKYIRKL